ncbi:GAF domain-containing protein [Catenovulum agarivorans]|uniref:GAF domain-containing protein n=1 Tax=Catenovulum agarivorans TaxID=1172192 RepID=UPI0002E6F2B2|nr:GAF domain-containing protein [Catenovulum agarivorans]
MQINSNQNHLADLFTNTMVQVSEYMNAQRATLFLADEQTNELWSGVASGAQVDEIRFADHLGIAGEVFQTGKIINIKDAYQDSRFNQAIDKKTGFKTNTILCAAVVNHQNKRIGVIQVLNKNNGTFNQDDQKLLVALASIAAVAIENALLRQKELNLTEQLSQKHKELQQAYISVENDNSDLKQQSKLNRMSKGAIISLATVIASIVAIFSYSSASISLSQHVPKLNQPKQDKAQFVSLEYTTVSDFMYLEGKVEPKQWLNITAPTQAKIDAVHFSFGDYVKKGQVLISLQSGLSDLALRQATSDYYQALKAYEQLADWQNSFEVKQAQRQVERAQQTLDKTKRNALHNQNLYEKGIISQLDVEFGQTALLNAQDQLDAANHQLDKIIEQGSEIKVNLAKLTLDNATKRKTQLEQQLNQSQLVSPTEGYIFPADKKADVSFHPGAILQANQQLFTIAEMTGISVQGKVSETELSKISLGQIAQVTIPAADYLSFTGTIRYISSRAEQSDMGNSFAIRIEVDNLSEQHKQDIRLGMTAESEILTYLNETAIVVPFSAIELDKGDKVVWLSHNGKLEQRVIESRTVLADGLEVIDGLSAGEQLLVNVKNSRTSK